MTDDHPGRRFVARHAAVAAIEWLTIAGLGLASGVHLGRCGHYPQAVLDEARDGHARQVGEIRRAADAHEADAERESSRADAAEARARELGDRLHEVLTERGGAAAARRAHIPEVAGSSPAPATATEEPPSAAPDDGALDLSEQRAAALRAALDARDAAYRDAAAALADGRAATSAAEAEAEDARQALHRTRRDIVLGGLLTIAAWLVAGR